jgi:hypothetical protein
MFSTFIFFNLQLSFIFILLYIQEVEVFGRQAYHITPAALVEKNNLTTKGRSTPAALLRVVSSSLKIPTHT